MDRSLFVSMSGAKETLLAQTAVSSNLANVNTLGFKADLTQFRSMPVFGPGHPSRVYALHERPITDFDPGPLMTTGRELDVAVQGEGWLAVQAPDGSEAYTRRGDLRLAPEGLLLTGDGLPVPRRKRADRHSAGTKARNRPRRHHQHCPLGRNTGGIGSNRPH
jgi:flagellar basal-body rod protein FlgF